MSSERSSESSEIIGEHGENEDDKKLDVGTEAPHIVCIDQLCQAAEICRRQETPCGDDVEINGEGEEADEMEELEKLKGDICKCIFDTMFDYQAEENARIQIKKEILEMMSVGQFVDEFMVFFMEDILDAIFGAFFNKPTSAILDEKSSKEALERVPVMNDDNIHFWMSYFYMQYCGFKLFLRSLASQAGLAITAKEEIASIITDVIDEITNAGDYLKNYSEDAEHVCKNILWGVLNTRRFHRRYINLTEDQILAADIIDDVIDAIRRDVGFTEGKPDSIIPKTEFHLGMAAICSEFMGVDKFANHFISRLIRNAKELSRKLHKKKDRFVGNINFDVIEEALHDLTDTKRPFPTIKEFSVEKGKAAIFAYMSEWETSESWLYDVNFLMAQSDACSDYYLYEAIWSIPTELYPVPQATASILFKIEVSRIKPITCDVDVTYTFEGRGLVHTPYKYGFNEEWLFDILYSKLKLYKKIIF